MNNNRLGSEIQKLRKEKGLTQEELAFKCGLSTRTIQRIESGEVDARTFTLNQIATALDVPLSHFTSEANEQFESALRKKKYDRKWLTLLHLSGLFVLLIPPIVIYLIKRDEVDEMNSHGRDVLNFQITMWLAMFFFAIPPILIVGIFILPLIGIFTTVYVIINTIRVMNDSPYHYPLTIQFIKTNISDEEN
jgi:transcriptional regulator with XRE-family HTH domain